MNQNHLDPLPINQVPRLLTGIYVNNDYQETIQIEYRYSIQSGYHIFTQIQNHDYRLSGNRFFDVISELLDQLPLSSMLVISHHAIIQEKNIKTIINLEEILYPYEKRNTATVVYKIKFSYGGADYETHPSVGFGGSGGSRGGTLEELRNMIRGKFILHACYFCKYLVDDNADGGTDFRHDQLYCLRDKSDVLEEIEKIYPQFRGAESLLKFGVPNMSALHSCSAFMNQERPRP